ncbi:hypothetical protein ACIBF1_35170 [Spirillospora sp. NPDC050679]
MWIAGTVLASAVLGLVVFAVVAGLGAADQLASVIGAIAGVAGLGVGLYSLRRPAASTSPLSEPQNEPPARPTPHRSSGPEPGEEQGGEGPGARSVNLGGNARVSGQISTGDGASQFQTTHHQDDSTHNQVSGGTFNGPLIMGRDISGAVHHHAPPPGSPQPRDDDQAGRDGEDGGAGGGSSGTGR